MVLYEVTLETTAELSKSLEQHMRQQHIPEIFATRCFREIHFERGSDSDSQFRTSYMAETQADLDRYIRDHAPRLRADFQTHFPTGVSASRKIWDVMERWG
jgi:hypothetical protein